MDILRIFETTINVMKVMMTYQTVTHSADLNGTLFRSHWILSSSALFPHFQDTNLRGRFGRTFLIQRSCVPLSLVYRAAHIPGCPKDVNPQLYYPAAHCCSCRRCDTRTHRCVRTSRIPYDQCFTTLDSVKKQNQSAVEISQYSNTSSSALARKWFSY